MFSHAKKLIVLGVASVGERNAQIWSVIQLRENELRNPLRSSVIQRNFPKI